MAKNILIDARLYGLENTGIGRYLINLIEELKVNGTKYNFTLILRKKYFNKLNLPHNWKNVLADFKHYGFEEQLFLPGLINKENPDLVHFPHLNIPLFWKGKFVVTFHDLTMQKQKTDASSLPIPLYYVKRIPFLLIAQKAVRESQRIIVPTIAVKEDIINYYNINENKIDVIYEGISNYKNNHRLILSENITTKYKINRPYFIYIGNAYPHKNLIKAMQAIIELNKKTNKKIILVIGGARNIFTKRLQNQVNYLNGGEYIKLIGFVKESDLMTLYKNSLGFVYPSLAEGYGLQGLEAMFAGTIVLSSNIPVFKEIYGDYAFYFNPSDSMSISDSMEYVLNLSEDRRNALISEAREFITKYSWSKMAEETLKVYNIILRKN